jgi:lantibiotic biosynthesis protein
MAASRASTPLSVKADPDVVAPGFFVLRTPLLPFDEFAAWSAGLEAPAVSQDAAALKKALAADRERLRGRLRTLVLRPEVLDALFVASPSLSESLKAWQQEPQSERSRDVERALVRYFERMTTRPTPFGLFAGCSVGQIGRETRLVLEARRTYGRHTRLDMHYLCGLAEALKTAPELRFALEVRPNSSLYRAAGRWRYVEARIDPKTRERSYHLVSVEGTDYLDATLARARDGALPGKLAAALADEEISYAEAEEYIGALIESQVLVPELEPAMTGPEPIAELIGRLRAHPQTLSHAERLAQTQAALADLDAAGVGLAPQRYREAARLLDGLPFEVELPRLFQVDMVKPAPEAVLGARVVAELARGVALLRRISPVREDDDLRRFLDAFAGRYEGREVPLTEALDEENGIGFGPTGEAANEASPLLEGLDFLEEATPAAWGPREAFLLGRIQEAVRRRQTAIELDERDVAALEASGPPPLPDAFAVHATLAAASQDEFARGRFRIYLQGCAGPSGANLLGRFCHGDAALQAQVERHLRAEEALRPDAVFAEIVHLPQGRLGNVILRPLLRDHEIPYIGRSQAPRERQIPVTDLLV